MPAKKSFLLRLDPEVYDELQAWAAQEMRSVNGQIEYVLVRALRARGRLRINPEEAAVDGPGDWAG